MEREYNIPLRKEFQKAPRYKRTPKAIKAIKAFIKRHMKTEDVKIGNYLNNAVWVRGIRNPPHHVKVTAKKDDEGIVFVEMVGAPVVEKQDPKKKKIGEKLKDMVSRKKDTTSSKPLSKPLPKTMPEPEKKPTETTPKTEPKPRIANPASEKKSNEKTEKQAIEKETAKSVENKPKETRSDEAPKEDKQPITPAEPAKGTPVKGPEQEKQSKIN